MSDEFLWIFGYGSLVWRPAFRHLHASPASIEGWTRRFWQGSTDHRGLPENPGRVVTLLPDHHPSIIAEASAPGPCWGSAYQVSPDDRSEVLAGLDHRERGGYARFDVEITLEPTSSGPRTVQGLMYVAQPDNENYLGPSSIEAIAQQVLDAAGPSGTNPEYVFELAECLRAMDAQDPHVFAIEAALTRLVRERVT